MVDLWAVLAGLEGLEKKYASESDSGHLVKRGLAEIAGLDSFMLLAMLDATSGISKPARKEILVDTFCNYCYKTEEAMRRAIPFMLKLLDRSSQLAVDVKPTEAMKRRLALALKTFFDFRHHSDKTVASMESFAKPAYYRSIVKLLGTERMKLETATFLAETLELMILIRHPVERAFNRAVRDVEELEQMVACYSGELTVGSLRSALRSVNPDWNPTLEAGKSDRKRLQPHLTQPAPRSPAGTRRVRTAPLTP
jgi:hypothetical protein